MLRHLSIRNFAIIRELEIDFQSGLLTVTGETGAGKSIILGALSLVLGERADTSVMDGSEEKCVVEAEFDISAYGLKPFFDAEDLDYEPRCLLRREITVQGKSRAFINDTPVSVQQLKELGEHLVDIHSQHETLSLKDRRYQVLIVDAFAKSGELLKNYQTAFKSFKEAEKSLRSLETSDGSLQSELDFYRFQWKELEEASLRIGEQEELEQEQARLEHASEISKTAFEGASLLKDAEPSIHDQLSQLAGALRGLVKVDSRFESLHERLLSADIELSDIARELETIADTTPADAQRLELVVSRLNLIQSLQSKHRVNSIEELEQKRYWLEDEIHRIEHLDESLEAARQRVNQTKEKAMEAGELLSKHRQQNIPALEHELVSLLNQVGMPHARVHIALEKADSLLEHGLEEVQMRFSSNAGMAPQPLHKAASGGELSRLMLCLKSILADNTALATLIFDEIDTGISGEVAAKVGRLMRKLAEGHQVISITHLPQIAGSGTHQYFVYKEVRDGKTYTGMKQLEEAERIQELAKMLSGDNPSSSALANAKELMLNG